jgi:hypothetical protein
MFPVLAFCQVDTVYDLNGENIDIRSLGKVDNGRLTLSLSTTNQDSIKINYQAFSSQGSNAKWAARLQYRVGKDGAWKDVPNRKQRAIEFVSAKYATSQSFQVTLPEDCNNKELVQLGWKIYHLKGKGANPNIGIRSIEIRSKNDPFTQEPQIFVEYKDNAKAVNDTIIFNHIALPHTYPDATRLKIYGFYLRGDITLQLEGADKEQFLIDTKSVNPDSAASKTITLYYVPKKEGKHTAQLLITTQKLSQPIKINVAASADKHPPFGESQTDNSIISIYKSEKSKYNSSLQQSVFSNQKYLFRFSLLSGNFTNFNIKYAWYRDDNLILETSSKVTNKDYKEYISSPALANKLLIMFESEKTLTLYNVYFGSPEVKTMIKSGDWDNKNNWQGKETPNTNDFIEIASGVKAEVYNNVFCSTLILSDSSNVHLRTNKTFYISDDIMYGKNAYFTVEQNLMPQKWNYISPPVNRTIAHNFSMRRSDNEIWLMEYNTGIVSEHGDHWSQYITDPEFVLESGHGYAIYTQKPLQVKYEGLLANSHINFPLVSQNKDRWNFLGNPFTASLDSRNLYQDLAGKIQGNAIFMLDSLGFYNPIIIDSLQTIIPSLSAFFVEALKTNSEITFKRSHQYIETNQSTEYHRKNYLTLSVSNNKSRSYSILQINPNSQNGFDMLDAHKLFGISDNPEIYTIVNNEELSVNTFAAFPAAFGVGLYCPQPSDVNINLSNLSSLEADGLNVFFEDKEQHSFQNLCDNATIKAHIEKGTTADRFRLHFVKALNVVDNKNFFDIYLWYDEGRILICDNESLLEQVVVRDGLDVIVSRPYDTNTHKVLEIKNASIKKSCVIDLTIDGVEYKNFYLDF